MATGDPKQPVEAQSAPTQLQLDADAVRFGSPSTITSVLDFDGYTVSINADHEAVLGWSVEELSSVPYWELLHPDDQDRSVDVRQRMLLSGPGYVLDHRVRMLCREGTYRYIRWVIRSFPVEERMYLVGVDITDREPIATEKRVLVGSWDWHIPTDTATWSDGMFEIYGIKPEPAVSTETALARLYINDRAAVEQAIRRSLTNAEPYTADHRIVHPDAGIRWLHSAGRVFLAENGEPQRMRGLTWDVTDRPGNRVPG